MFGWLQRAFRESKPKQKPLPESDPVFKLAKLPPRRSENSRPILERPQTAPIALNASTSKTDEVVPLDHSSQNGTIEVESYMSFHLMHPSEKYHLGAIWKVRLVGDIKGVLAVRSYLPKAKLDAMETKKFTDRVVLFVFEKMRQGWRPQAGPTDVLEMGEDEMP